MFTNNRAGYILQNLRDCLFVLRSLWLLLLFNLIAFFAFIIIPQGTDILLEIIEPKSFIQSSPTIILLWIALFCWSVSSEFCTRFIIYVTDNSGHTLSPYRVDTRKKNQKNIAQFFLYFPSALLAVAFINTYFQNLQEVQNSRFLLCTILFLLLLQALLLAKLYRAKRKKSNSKIFRWMQLSEHEKYWTSKLYGIFNDYRVDLNQQEIMHLQDDLPREMMLSNGSLIPSEFILKSKPFRLPDNKNILVWMYQIPLYYYKNLIIQLIFLSLSAITLILILSFSDISIYQRISSITLLCFAFASWQMIYTLLHFLDKAQPLPKINLPYRFIVLIWLCFCSYINNDHPVRSTNEKPTKNVVALPIHFKNWYEALEQKEDSSNRKKVAVFFIAAEGGALRTGAFTALLLAKLQDSFPEFKNHIYCYSSVSGGTLGVNLFNSLHNDLYEPLQYGNTIVTKQFFEADFLAAVTGKLVFGEVLNYFIPIHIASLDRAIALENSWENSWGKATKSIYNGENLFSAAFDNNIRESSPALFINTVESETGLPCVWTNTSLEKTFPLSNLRDLRNKYQISIPYSTAINLSTRFPLISPAAMFELNNTNNRFHYVDGGYYENKGQETLLQVLNAIDLKKYPAIRPYIIQFNFSQDTTMHTNIRFANDVMEIINVFENTRLAKAQLTIEELKIFMAKNFSEEQIINLNLDITQKKLPMNWLLSKTAMKRVDLYTDSLMHLQKDPQSLNKLFTALNHH